MLDSVVTRSLATIALGALAAGGAAAWAQTTTAADQAQLSMTLYQQGFALIRDERTVELPPGRLELRAADISDQIVPESVLVTGQGLALHAAVYAGASLTADSLLASQVGQTVRVLRSDPSNGQLTEEEGVLLSAAGGVPIVQIGDRVEIGGPGAPWRLGFEQVPDTLQGEPALTLTLDNTTRGPQSLALTYLSRGLTWQADYVGVLQGENALTFSGWVSLENATNTAFPTARIQLLAGDVNQADNGVRPFQAMARSAEIAAADMASAPVADYHLYDLPEPVTLLPAQRRQERLLAPREVQVEREYRLSSNRLWQSTEETTVPVAVSLTLRNEQPALGLPLPAGRVRIYAEGLQGGMQYLGEDRIGHTAVGEPLTLRLGTAFDVLAKRTTQDIRRIDQQTTELQQQIRLINRKQEPVTVVVAEQLAGEWEILSSSHPYQKASAQLAEWRIEIPADSEQSLTYAARIRY